MTTENRQVRKINRLFLLQIVFIILVSLLGGRFLSELPARGSLLASQLIYAFLPFLFVILYYRNMEFGIPLGKFRISTLLMTLLFTVLLLPVTSALNAFSMIFVENYVVEMQTGLESVSMAEALFAVAFVPAFLEELVYRGIFFGCYRKLGIVKGAILVGIVFGVLHMNFNQFAYAFFIGIAFCFLMEATGNIIYCMIAHFFINGWSTVLSSLGGGAEALGTAAAALTREDMVNAFCVYAVIGAVTGTLAVCVLVWIADHNGTLNDMKGNLRGEKGGITLPFILAVVIGVAFMVLREFL